MAKHNYTNYSKQSRKPEETPVPTELVIPMSKQASVLEPEETPAANAAANAVAKPEPITGVVDNCLRLNVREKPSIDAEILTALEAGSEVRLLKDEIENGFYKVCTASGLDGYCMCEYIVLK